MKNLVFATGNIHKLQEVQGLFKEGFALSCLKDVNITEEIPETADNLVDNALQKAIYVYEKCGIPCFADDTGLEVDALDGAPGVYSARYAGTHTSYDIKNNLLLERLQGVPDEKRTARFVCAVAAAFPDGSTEVVRGTIEGIIGHEIAGENGFGYDPIFYLPEYGCTTAELSPEKKNELSHRGNALREMREIMEKKA